MTVRITRTLAAAVVLAAMAASPAAAQAPGGGSERVIAGQPFVPGEVLVRFSPSTGGGARAQARDREGVDFGESLPAPGLQLVETEPGTSVGQAVRGLEMRPEVAYAQPNFIRRRAALPQDENLFEDLWGLQNTGQAVETPTGTQQAGTPDADISAPQAWDVTTGSDAVTAAVVDGGIDYRHPDLRDNIWDGVGRDFCGRTLRIDQPEPCDGQPDDDPMDAVDGHGTHVAGTIGADGTNGAGLPGVNWESAVMAVRVANNRGHTTDALLTEGFAYAAGNGARVVNASFGAKGPAAAPALQQVVRRSQSTLFVVAAGNGTNNDSRQVNNDRSPDFLCNIEAPNLVCVTASTQNDGLAGFANYGVRSVDLAAPGVNILSTDTGGFAPDPLGDYAVRNGTSMATPHVAGAAALGFAHEPGATPPQMKCALVAGVDVIPNPFVLTTASGGRLNADRTLDLLSPDQRPAACITQSPPARGNDATVSFEYEASRPGTTFQCRLDGRAFDCGPSLSTEVGDGNHVFQVRPRSPGQTPPWSDRTRVPTHRFLVDSAAPRMGLPGRRLDLVGRRISVRTLCPAGELSGPCTGNLQLRSARPIRVGNRRQQVVFGSVAFRAAPGSTVRRSIRVSRADSGLIERRGNLQATLRAVGRDSLGNQAVRQKGYELTD